LISKMRENSADWSSDFAFLIGAFSIWFFNCCLAQKP